MHYFGSEQVRIVGDRSANGLTLLAGFKGSLPAADFYTKKLNSFRPILAGEPGRIRQV